MKRLQFKKFKCDEDLLHDHNGYMTRTFYINKVYDNGMEIGSYEYGKESGYLIWEGFITMEKFNEIDKEFVPDYEELFTEYSIFYKMIESTGTIPTIIDWDSDYVSIKVNDYDICFERDTGKFVEISNENM